MQCLNNDSCRAGRGNHLPTCPRRSATRGGRPGRRGVPQVSVSSARVETLRQALKMPADATAAQVLERAESIAYAFVREHGGERVY